MLNVINGGAHAQNSIDLQEFMVVPAGAASFARGAADRRGGLPRAEARAPRARARDRVGDEGGFAPDLASSEEAIEAILEAAERAGHRDRIAIALDPAATEFYDDGRYLFEGRDEDGAGMVGFWEELADALPDRLDRGRPRRGRLGRRGGR